MLDILNPVKAVKSLLSVFKDISNYLFYRKRIKKIDEEGYFKDRKARVDWLNRVYYVLNLEPELQLATGDIVDLEKSRVYESVYKFQGVFATNNLVEIVDISSKRIKSEDFYAYLVTISYKITSTWKDLFRIILLGVLIYLLIHLGLWLGENWQVVLGKLQSVFTSK